MKSQGFCLTGTFAYLLCEHVFSRSQSLPFQQLQRALSLCLPVLFISAASELHPCCLSTGSWSGGVAALLLSLFLVQCCLSLACDCNIQHFSFFSISVDFGLMSDSCRQQYPCVFKTIKPAYLPHQNRVKISSDFLTRIGYSSSQTTIQNPQFGDGKLLFFECLPDSYLLKYGKLLQFC